MVTPRSVYSRHCRDEVQYALKLGKPIVVVYLEPTELPPGLELTLGSIQAVHRRTDDPSAHRRKLLETIDAPVEEMDRPKAAPGHGAPAVGPLSQRRPSAPYKARRYAVTVLVVALAAATAFYLYRTAQPPAVESVTLGPNSIAVLPLEDRGGFDDDPDYPDSVSEDLLNRLTGIRSVQVASRRSSFEYRTAELNELGLVEIGRRLGVSNVLSGYLTRKKDTLRVNVELVDVSSGREVVRWSNNYDKRAMSDILTIQGDVTRAVARELSANGLSVEDEYRIASQATVNPAAYDFYLQAKTILRAPLEDGVSLERAGDLFNRALALDGNFVWARAGLCSTDLRAYFLGKSFDAAEASCSRLIGLDADLFDVNLALGAYFREKGQLTKAATALETAVEQVPNSADAKIAIARLYAQQAALSQSELDRVRAEEAYLEAIAVEPGYWYSYHDYARYLVQNNRLEDALAQMKIALSIEPGSVATLTNYGNALYRLGRTEEAEETWTRALRLTGNNRWAHEGLGVMYHYQGRFDEAVEQLVAACEISPEDHRLWGKLGESYRLLPGEESAAQEAFTKGLALAEKDAEVNPDDWSTTGYIALYLAYLGDFDRANLALERMFELNPGREQMTHYWAGLVAFEENDIERTFHELELALADGFGAEKHFIADEPALAELRRNYPERFQAMLDRH